MYCFICEIHIKVTKLLQINWTASTGNTNDRIYAFAMKQTIEIQQYKGSNLYTSVRKCIYLYKMLTPLNRSSAKKVNKQ